MRVEILLAAWNGADHLGAQLESLVAQSHREWVVTASDDGSTDTTLAPGCPACCDERGYGMPWPRSAYGLSRSRR
jgi:hypothetical protein